MASTPAEMAGWDRYPTYSTYLSMMQQWVSEYPALCRLDTIGTSINGRLILSLELSSALNDSTLPEFFYSSTIHGDEITGFVMMLRLIDTLLSSYGQSERLTALLDGTHICINPLSNPDGTYYSGDNSVQNARRYNARNIDLNRRYPDPFRNYSYSIPQENQLMISYMQRHHFSLSANLHGGAEVLNYPWDSFTSLERPHPDAEWWKALCRKCIDTLRAYPNGTFDDVEDSGFIAGGDWYVIGGGRQDYVNQALGCLEITMEISVDKQLSSNRLPEYWRFLAPMLITYMEAVHTLPTSVGIPAVTSEQLSAYPNPTTGQVFLSGIKENEEVEILDIQGHLLMQKQGATLDLSPLPQGIYLLRTAEAVGKIIKR